MPSKTPKQQRAMAAAAHGNSTIGIPKSVGREYMLADALQGKGFTKSKKPSYSTGGAAM